MARQRRVVLAVALSGALGFTVAILIRAAPGPLNRHTPKEPIAEKSINWSRNAPVEFLPYEGLEHNVRKLVEPDYAGTWSGTGYDVLHLNAYVAKWYRHARDRTFSLAGWTFGVGLAEEKADPEQQTILTTSYVVGALLPGAGYREVVNVRLWAKRVRGQ